MTLPLVSIVLRPKRANRTPVRQICIAHHSQNSRNIAEQAETQSSMAPTWRRSSTSQDDSAREAARQAARRRREIYMQIRSHLAAVYPTYPSLIVRSQQTVGAGGIPNYVAVVLYEAAQSSRITPQNPVIGYDEQYYDDRLLTAEDLSRYTVLLNGTPGASQTEGMERLLERIEVLVRSGWRSGG